MSPTVKRALLILGFLVLVGLIGFGLYYMFTRSQAPTATRPPVAGAPTGSGALPGSQTRTTTAGVGDGGVGAGGLPTAGITRQPDNQNFYRPQAVTQLTKDLAVYPSVASNNGSLRYHNASDGKFYKTNADGSLSSLSDQVFFNVQDVTWAKTQDKAVLSYPDGSKIVYDFAKNKQVTLPKHWEDFSFSPDSSEIAAKSIGLSPENRWLVTTKDDGTGTKLIEPLGNNAEKVIVDWSPSRQVAAFSKTGAPQGADRSEIFLLGLGGENFKSIIVEGLDFQSQWSTTGQKLLYSVDSARSGYKPELWITNAYGDQIGSGRLSLQLNTWAEKCTFADDNTVYCAAPRELPEGAGMVPEIARTTPDDLYKIDLKTGLKTPIALDKNYTFDTVSYDATRKKVIFTDTQQVGAFQVNL
jgi:hypothetical protein